MKTFNMFYLVIYWTQNVQNDFISYEYVVSSCHLSATLQTISIIVETIELWLEFLSRL